MYECIYVCMYVGTLQCTPVQFCIDDSVSLSVCMSASFFSIDERARTHGPTRKFVQLHLRNIPADRGGIGPTYYGFLCFHSTGNSMEHEGANAPN